MTDCYKCGAETEALEDAVHPLCEECENDFSSWFMSQVGMVSNA